jgi:hypothetical protein
VLTTALSCPFCCLPCLSPLSILLPLFIPGSSHHSQGLNRRDPSVFDMYSLDMNTLTLTLHTVNTGQVNSWQMDWDFNIRVSSSMH